MFLAIERGNGRLRLFVAAHLHESKTFAPSGVPVGD
jgi:hypothetical protein